MSETTVIKHFLGLVPLLEEAVKSRYGHTTADTSACLETVNTLRAALRASCGLSAPPAFFRMTYEELKKVDSLLKAPNPKCIVFTGDAGAGKTAAINAVFRCLLLPSAARGTAATKFPCFVCYADTWSVHVTFYTEDEWTEVQGKTRQSSRRKQPFPRTYKRKFQASDDLHTHLKELMEARRSTYVKKCSVNGPIAFLKDGKIVVDLPGCNDVNSFRLASNREILAGASFSAIVADVKRVLDNKTVHDLLEETVRYRMARNVATHVSAVVCTCTDAHLGEWGGEDDDSSVDIVRQRNKHVKDNISKVLNVTEFSDCFCLSARYYLHREGVKKSRRDCRDPDLLEADLDWTGVDELRERIQAFCNGLDADELTEIVAHLLNARRILEDREAMIAHETERKRLRDVRDQFAAECKRLCDDSFGAIAAATSSHLTESKKARLETALETGDYANRNYMNPDGMHWATYRSHMYRSGAGGKDMNLTLASIIWEGAGKPVAVLDTFWVALKDWAQVVVRANGKPERYGKGLEVFVKEVDTLRNKAQMSFADQIKDILRDTYSEAAAIRGRGSYVRMKETLRRKLGSDRFHSAILGTTVTPLGKAIDALAENLLNHVFIGLGKNDEGSLRDLLKELGDGADTTDRGNDVRLKTEAGDLAPVKMEETADGDDAWKSEDDVSDSDVGTSDDDEEEGEEETDDQTDDEPPTKKPRF